MTFFQPASFSEEDDAVRIIPHFSTYSRIIAFSRFFHICPHFCRRRSDLVVVRKCPGKQLLPRVPSNLKVMKQKVPLPPDKPRGRSSGCLAPAESFENWMPDSPTGGVGRPHLREVWGARALTSASPPAPFLPPLTHPSLRLQRHFTPSS